MSDRPYAVEIIEDGLVSVIADIDLLSRFVKYGLKREKPIPWPVTEVRVFFYPGLNAEEVRKEIIEMLEELEELGTEDLSK